MSKNEIAMFDVTAKMWLGRFPETPQSLVDSTARQREDTAKGHVVWIVYYNNRTPQGGMTA